VYTLFTGKRTGRKPQAKEDETMTTLAAKKSTLKTVEANGFNRQEFDGYMSGYGYTTRNELGCIAIVDESGESVDWAHPIIISHKGSKCYDVLLSEMESFFEVGGESFNTINDDVNVSMFR
jgi:hypothetical protein